MKLPSVQAGTAGEVQLGEALKITAHPDTVMTLGLVGLEILQDVSVVGNAVPFTRTSPPIRWLPGLSVID